MITAETTRAEFEALLDTEFTVAAQTPIVLVLKAVAKLGHGRPGARDPFALTFVGPATPKLQQSTYTLKHPTFGDNDLFIVPVGPGEGGMRYEAIFS